MGTTEDLARFIAGTQYDDLPVEVVAAAKIAILDGVSNLLAGSTQPVAQIASAYTLELGGIPVSSVIGYGLKTNPLNAAFANGVSGHCLDFEFQGQPSSHGTSSILPGPLALAEAQGGASGKELIVAYALGWDVQQRIVAASHRAGANLRGFHPPGVYGPLEGAAAAAKMLKLNQARVQMALGIAASRTGGLDGKFSFEYCAIIPLVTNPVGIDSFSDATRFTPAVDEALTKVSRRHNPAIGRGANAIVTMKDGRVLQGECRDFRGSIRNPMTRDEHDVKYLDCAQRVLPPEDIDRVRDMVENLERLADIRQLIALLAASSNCQPQSSVRGRLIQGEHYTNLLPISVKSCFPVFPKQFHLRWKDC